MAQGQFVLGVQDQLVLSFNRGKGCFVVGDARARRKLRADHEAQNNRLKSLNSVLEPGDVGGL